MTDLQVPQAWTLTAFEPVDAGPVRPRTRSKRRLLSGRMVLTLLLVAIPVALTATYLFGFAADRYESQAVFVVRSPAQPGAGMLTGGMGVTAAVSQAGVPMGADDSYAVREFILSRDAMRRADAALDLRRVFAAPASDPLWHFPSALGQDTQEGLYRAYLRHVAIRYDFNTNVSILTVQACSAQAAQRLAAVLLTLAEELVNQLNLRGQQDALRAAEADVASTREAAQAAITAMMAFRNREQVVDPVSESKLLADVLLGLTTQLITVRAQIDVVRATSPNSPQLASLQAKAASITTQIDTERARIGHGDAALAPRIAAYEGLALDEAFTSRALMLALAALDAARQDALRKHVYLERIAAPQAPDEAQYPWRRADMAAVSLAAFLVLLLLRPRAERTRATAAA